MAETKKTKKPKSKFEIVPRDEIPISAKYTEYDKALDEFLEKGDTTDALRFMSEHKTLQSARAPFKTRVDRYNKNEDREFDLKITTSTRANAIYLTKEPKGSVKTRTRNVAQA
jgi:hypothetical protein